MKKVGSLKNGVVATSGAVEENVMFAIVHDIA